MVDARVRCVKCAEARPGRFSRVVVSGQVQGQLAAAETACQISLVTFRLTFLSPFPVFLHGYVLVWTQALF